MREWKIVINVIKQKLNCEKGFTLVELMVVVAILAILAALAVPRISNATDSAKQAQIMSDLRTIDSAITMYYTDVGTYPASIASLVTTATVSGSTKGPWLVNTPTPPKGSVNISGTGQEITQSYAIDATANRATITIGGTVYNIDALKTTLNW